MTFLACGFVDIDPFRLFLFSRFRWLLITPTNQTNNRTTLLTIDQRAFNLQKTARNALSTVFMHSQLHHGLTDKRPITSRLRSPIRSTTRDIYTTHWRSTIYLTLKMTSAQVVETSVNITSNSPSQDYTHPDDHNLRPYDMTPGFKPFTVIWVAVV